MSRSSSHSLTDHEQKLLQQSRWACSCGTVNNLWHRECAGCHQQMPPDFCEKIYRVVLSKYREDLLVQILDWGERAWNVIYAIVSFLCHVVCFLGIILLACIILPIYGIGYVFAWCFSRAPRTTVVGTLVLILLGGSKYFPVAADFLDTLTPSSILIGRFLHWLSDLLDSVGGFLNAIVEPVSSWFHSKDFGGAVVSLWKGLCSWFSSAWIFIRKWAPILWDFLAELSLDIWHGTRSLVSKYLDFLGFLIAKIWYAVWEAMDTSL